MINNGVIHLLFLIIFVLSNNGFQRNHEYSGKVEKIKSISKKLSFGVFSGIVGAGAARVPPPKSPPPKHLNRKRGVNEDGGVAKGKDGSSNVVSGRGSRSGGRSSSDSSSCRGRRDIHP